ncbi:methylated-DNA--[protein]-cysteine S-methyltransferase [Streptococcus iniae]|uniref:methylated-DNA--[protein]-cysteine S-methyltransferase n=2 Tax=Streptococcus iniae TaxID=1346 RepID=UPI0008D8F2AE|nr:methylated-DNA--[protein]-cysteine S-methyltransferase [Streptococcus iniae]OHX27532.1 cysteine methyltransferase [Streptococcus iniae]RLV27333.1 methylated-DNA--[protein]-cysteine S-methyltransferase [Streptococcus iniae]
MTLYKTLYQTPLGQMSLVADDSCLIGAYFMGQKYFEAQLSQSLHLEINTPLKQAMAWLDTYFAGENPGMPTFLKAEGTVFQQKVWDQLRAIPLGETATYGEIAAHINCQSAQAVGGAVGRNPLSLFVPCHRVIGSSGQITGYAGGIDKKLWLLAHEKQLLKEKK